MSTDTGWTRRHAGQDANLAAAAKPHRDERSHVEAAVAQLAQSGEPFTADGVHALVTDLSNRNVVSSVLGHWAKDGRIRAVGYAVSTRRSRHASRNQEWIGRHGEEI